MIGFNYIASPGRLGNQMFKYAALRGIANNISTDFLIPPSYKKLENYPLMFKIAIKFLIPKNKQNHLLFEYFEMSSIKKKNVGYIETENVIEETQFNFDENIFHTSLNNFNLQGYFQTYKYFENVETLIKNDFKFKKNTNNKCSEIISRFDNPTSIHIRRGDYLTTNTHNPLEQNYYEKGIEEISQKSDLIIFTDDVEWCKNNSFFKKKNIYFAHEFTKSIDILDLCLMTKCKNHIIANSVFSWWGAYLSHQEKVIAPKYWFKNTKNSNLNTEDLIPNSWIQIEN